MRKSSSNRVVRSARMPREHSRVESRSAVAVPGVHGHKYLQQHEWEQRWLDHLEEDG